MRKVTIREATRHVFAEHGFLGMFKGLSPTLTRSFIVNAVTLPTFDYLNDNYCITGGGNFDRRQKSD